MASSLMIVTCPSCSARYKINEAKVKGRGAKITCPRCAHRFVFYRDSEVDGSSGADPAAQLDFRAVGMQWRVRASTGAREFTKLATLKAWLAEGSVSPTDVITFNGRKWIAIHDIKDISAFFTDIHHKAGRGEIGLYDASQREAEDDSDAPTTIAGSGSALANEIQDLVRELATPAPVGPRGRGPGGRRPDPSEDEPAEIVHDQPSAPLYAVRGNARAPAPAPAAPAPGGKPEPPSPAKPAAAGPASGESGAEIVPWMIGGLVVVALVGAGLWFGGVFNGGHAPPVDVADGPAEAP